VARNRSLSTLLSQLLVAFTIEFDNESERQILETKSGPKFLVSLVMWSNYLRFVEAEGTRVSELHARARVSAASMKSRLGAFTRWRYVTVEPSPGGSSRTPSRDALVRFTPKGRIAREIWRPLPATIEKRWEARFGVAEIRELRGALASMIDHLGARALPRYLPVIGYGMFASVEPASDRDAHDDGESGAADLSALLSRVLLAFTLEYERKWPLSLTVSANLLRVLSDGGVQARALPALTGISKEAVEVATSFLAKRGHAAVEPNPTAPRGNLVRLTAEGARARDSFHRRLADIESGWCARYGEDVRRLRESLERLLSARDGERLRLAAGLKPSAGGWRARKPYATQTAGLLADPIAALPHHPQVSHRGGWPDGS
jgi:DNA-binding MarR family transcriptional regulator